MERLQDDVPNLPLASPIVAPSKNDLTVCRFETERLSKIKHVSRGFP